MCLKFSAKFLDTMDNIWLSLLVGQRQYTTDDSWEMNVCHWQRRSGQTRITQWCTGSHDHDFTTNLQ